MSSALIGYWHADIFSIEDPVVGAGKTDLVVPVPSRTTGVGRLGIVEFREDALTVFQVVSLIASGAVTIGSMSRALIRNWGTDIFSIEDPAVGAGEADLVIPVPSSTSTISGSGSIGK